MRKQTLKKPNYFCLIRNRAKAEGMMNPKPALPSSWADPDSRWDLVSGYASTGSAQSRANHSATILYTVYYSPKKPLLSDKQLQNLHFHLA